MISSAPRTLPTWQRIGLACAVGAVGATSCWWWLRSNRPGTTPPPAVDRPAPTEPAAPVSFRGLILDIESRRTLVVHDGWEAMEGSRAREARIDELLRSGVRAERELLEYVSQRLQDRESRKFWLPVLLRTEEVDLQPLMARLGSLGLSDAEWMNVAYELRGRPESWACDLALRLSEHPDPSVRKNAIRALGDWPRPDARAAVAKALRSEAEPVRFAAIGATESSGFSGSMEELDGLLECASEAGTTVSVRASEALERLVADAIQPPAVGYFGRRDWSRFLAGGRTSIRWDSSTRRFIANVPR